MTGPGRLVFPKQKKKEEMNRKHLSSTELSLTSRVPLLQADLTLSLTLPPAFPSNISLFTLASAVWTPVTHSENSS